MSEGLDSWQDSFRDDQLAGINLLLSAGLGRTAEPH